MLDRHYHIALAPPSKESTSDLEALYLKAAELRDFEITQLVQRNNFFMIFQGFYSLAFFNLRESF